MNSLSVSASEDQDAATEKQSFDLGAARHEVGVDRSRSGGGGLLPTDLEVINATVQATFLPGLRGFGGLAGVDGGASLDRTPRISDDDVVLFADICVNCEVDEPMKFIRRMVDSGVSLEAIYLDLISPAAKYLGDLWADDRFDFTHVTLGISCMQRAMSALVDKFESQNDLVTERTALMLSMPNDQHSLGGYMAAQFMRRYGWFVTYLNPKSMDEVFSLISRQAFDLIGFSLSYQHDLAKLSHTVSDIRAAAVDESTIILAGGQATLQNYDEMQSLSVDGLGVSGRDTVLKANDLYLKKMTHSK